MRAAGNTFIRLVLSIISLAAFSCGYDYVKVDKMHLGRVVVYRNGVAYYERRAKLKGNELRLSVPKTKVNDFLKSLTVKDATTGKSLPVTFPAHKAGLGDMIDVVVRLPQHASTEVLLSYISDAPAWKPSYRVVIGDKGDVKFEGWAVVDNTSGEDWKDVLVGVGSGSALSFRYDLWSIRDVQRQTLVADAQFVMAPPSGGATHGGNVSAAGEGVITELGTEDLPTQQPPNVPGQGSGQTMATMDSSEDVETVTISGSSIRRIDLMSGAPPTSVSESRSSASERRADRARQEAAQKAAARQQQLIAERQRTEAKAQRIVRKLADSLIAKRQQAIIEGVAAADEPQQRALDRAHSLRNQLIGAGVPPAQISARAAPASAGRPAGVRVLAAGSSPKEAAQTDTRPIGDSHFLSATPVSVQRDSTVMVSVVDQATEGELVYLYDAESTRGNRKFAFKAVRLKNPTAYTLESGPVTVYGSNRFIGEGLTEPIAPNAVAIIPFALDRQIVAEVEQSTADEISRLVALERGVLRSEIKHTRKTKISVTNRMNQAATVYIRHTVRPGWHLAHAPKDFERLGDAHLFRVQLKARETRPIEIRETTPMSKTLDLRHPGALDLVAVHLSGADIDAALAPKLAQDLKRLTALHRTTFDHKQEINSLREHLARYRARTQELQDQLLALKDVRGSGELTSSLQRKFRQLSDLVHKTTLQIVDHQEKMMLSRITFQDAVAEMTLEPARPGVAEAGR